MPNARNKSKKIISTTQLKAAIRAYKLKGLIIHLPPKAYKRIHSSVINALRRFAEFLSDCNIKFENAN